MKIKPFQSIPADQRPLANKFGITAMKTNWSLIYVYFASIHFIVAQLAIQGSDTIENWQQKLGYVPAPTTNRLQANVVLHVNSITTDSFRNNTKKRSGTHEYYDQTVKNVIINDMSQSGLFKRVDSDESRNDIDLVIDLDIQNEKPNVGFFSATVVDPYTREKMKFYHKTSPQKFRQAMADIRASLYADFNGMDFARRRQLGEEARQRAQFEEAENTKRREQAETERRQAISREIDQDDSGKVLFKLQPDDQFTVSRVTEYLITWKNRHLDNVLRTSSTSELRDYVDQIEHTIFQATDASEKEKDEAQRLIAGGVNAEHEHTDLARAYSLRIEVLKPILTTIKNEIANRGK